MLPRSLCVASVQVFECPVFQSQCPTPALPYSLNPVLGSTVLRKVVTLVLVVNSGVLTASLAALMLGASLPLEVLIIFESLLVSAVGTNVPVRSTHSARSPVVSGYTSGSICPDISILERVFLSPFRIHTPYMVSPILVETWQLLLEGITHL